MNARRRSIHLGIAALALLALTGCSADAQPGPATSPSSGAATPAATAVPQPSAPPTSEAALSCESLLPPETVADFGDIGWTAEAKPFYAGSVELVDGIQCTWGDYSMATDHVQIFGWAPISDTQSAQALDELVSGGWTREDSADGIYITESPETAIATDDQGYGFTYLFGEGWVTVADTKQGLLLIERPGA